MKRKIFGRMLLIAIAIGAYLVSYNVTNTGDVFASVASLPNEVKVFGERSENSLTLYKLEKTFYKEKSVLVKQSTIINRIAFPVETSIVVGEPLRKLPTGGISLINTGAPYTSDQPINL